MNFSQDTYIIHYTIHVIYNQSRHYIYMFFNVVQRQGTTERGSARNVSGVQYGGEHLSSKVHLRREVYLRSNVMEWTRRVRNGQTIVNRVSFLMFILYRGFRWFIFIITIFIFYTSLDYVKTFFFYLNRVSSSAIPKVGL
jgi:hypothetical protein